MSAEDMTLGEYVDVDGLKIYYEKVGHGPKVLLFLPGGCGTGRSDFTPQLDNFNQDMFTIIAWDPPGYGRSRPPRRVYKLERTFATDAETAHKMMIKLGHDKYSCLEWSDGGKTAMFMAIKFSASVESIVLIGSGSYKTNIEQQGLDLIENLDDWDARTLEPYLKVYARDDFQSLWAQHVNFYRKFKTICKDKVCLIKCPTLFVCGAKDPLCPAEHARFYRDNIRDITIKIFDNGVHNVHHVFADEFNSLAQQFFINH